MAAERLSFIYPRIYPALPRGYDWETQKKKYCPRDLLTHHLPGLPGLSTKLGYVFCHRGLYERSSAIVDNSPAAIANGIREGFFLHEVDAFIWDKLEKSFIAHDKNPERVTSKTEPWTNYSLHDILHTSLVTRRFDPETLDLASSYMGTEDTVPGLLGSLWRELLESNGRTMLIDFRDEDFVKAIPYLSFHIRRWRSQHTKPARAEDTLFWHLTNTTMLKGYNIHFRSFSHLRDKIREHSMAIYGEDHFKMDHLRLLPPLIMVFYPGPLVKLAEETTPSGSDSDVSRRSYAHLYRTFMDQVTSYVNIGRDRYNFILEIVHSGLGLGYDKNTGDATNPLDGKPLKEKEVIFDSLVDRVMIDVSLELRKRYSDSLIFSSCTRLADVITPKDGEFKASWITSKLIPMEKGENGLAAKLRAIHGGLYPQCHLVVADDPAAEIAARTWIDQKSDLDREDLLHTPYEKWLAGAEDEVVAAITELNNQPFLANAVGEPEAMEDSTPGSPVAESTASIVNWMDNGSAVDDGAHGSHPSSDREASDNGGSDDYEPTEAEQPTILNLGRRKYRLVSEAEAKQLPAGQIQTAHKAAETGDVELLRKVLYHMDVNDETGPYYGTMLGAACANGHTEVVELLLGEEADINLRGTRGSPLRLAVEGGHLEILKLLIKCGARPSLGFESGYGPSRDAILPAACQGGRKKNLEIIRILLELGANVQQEGPHGTAIEVASEAGFAGIVELLLRFYSVAKIGVRTCSAALGKAAMRGHKDIVKRLLAEGIRLDGPTNHNILLRPEIAALLARAGSAGDGRRARSASPGRGFPGVDRAQERSRVLYEHREERDRRIARRIEGAERRRAMGKEWQRQAPSVEEKVFDRAITPSNRRQRDLWMDKMEDFTLEMNTVVRREPLSCGCLLCRIDRVIQPSVSSEVTREIRRKFMNRVHTKGGGNGVWLALEEMSNTQIEPGSTWATAGQTHHASRGLMRKPQMKVVKNADFEELLTGEQRDEDN